MRFTPTIPNYISIFRIVLIIPLITCIWIETFWSFLAALLIYVISAISDTLDGIIARKLNQESEFGAYIDPLADKIMIWSVFIVFAFKQELMIPFWMIIPIIGRDIAVTYLRSYSKKKHIEFKTSFIAKAKTTVQMISALFILGHMFIPTFFRFVNKLPESLSYIEIWQTITPNYSIIIYIPLLLTILTMVFTIYTGIDYYLIYKKNRDQAHESSKNG